MGCIVCCPAVYLVGLLPWQPAPDWPGSLRGLWMQRSAAVSYPGCPDTVQKLCAPAGLSHSHHGPTPPEQRPARCEQTNSFDFNTGKTFVNTMITLLFYKDKHFFLHIYSCITVVLIRFNLLSWTDTEFIARKRTVFNEYLN